MASKSTITVKILGDAKGLQGTLNQADGLLGGFGKTAGKALAIGGTALAGMGAAAVAFAPDILAAGTELDALAKKSATVFEDSLPQVQEWAKENAKAMGLTATEAVGVGAGIADLLKPMGFTAEAAAGMTTDMLDLSGALSAWSGGQKSSAEVAEIITKAMLGERDGLKALGISISEADVQARLAKNGQEELTGAALEQAKALATQELIFEKSTDAQKAWTDGSMDAVKAQNESEASIAQLKETAVKALYPALQAVLPIVGDMAAWLGEKLPGAIAWLQQVVAAMVAKWKEWWPSIKVVVDLVAAGIGALVGWFQQHWDEISTIVAKAIGYVQGAISTAVEVIQFVWRNFGDEIVTVIKGAWDLISGIVEAAVNFVKGVINVVMGLIRGDWSLAWDGIKGIVSGVWEAIKALIDGALAAIKAVLSVAWEVIRGAAYVAWDAIKVVIMTPINAVSDLLGKVWDTIKGVAETAWKAVAAVIEPIIGTIVAIVRTVVDAIQSAIDKFNELKDLAFGGAKIPDEWKDAYAQLEAQSPASSGGSTGARTNTAATGRGGAMVVNLNGYVSERMVTELMHVQSRYEVNAA